jgi:hypothetical protein
MALDPSIILAGRAPDIIGSIDAGNIAGQRRNEFVRTNALNAFLQESGPGIMSGDQNALAGLARFDPTAAMGIQGQRQQMAMRDETMQMAREQVRVQAQQQAAAMTAEQRAQEAQQIERVLSGASAFYAQGDQAGYTSWLQQNQLDPAQYPFEQFPAIAAMAGGVLETLNTFQDMNAPAEAASPQSAIAKLQQDLTNGLITQDQFDLALQNMAPTGMSITSDGRGGFTMNQGVGVGGPAGGAIPEQQSKIQLFGTMMDVAAPVINEIETTYDPANFQDAAAAQLGWGGNYMKSGDGQRYQVAAQAWSEGALRLSTGAAALQAEIDRVAATYFAVPGDQPETVTFKRQMREAYEQALIAASGGTFVPGATTLPDDPNAPVIDPIAFAEQATGETATDQRPPDFSQMSQAEVLAFDPLNATIEEIAAWNKRMDELGL